MESDGKLVVNLTRGSIVCESVEIANRPRRRMRGLLGRKSLPSGEGIFLQPAPSIHTAFMRFAFDAIFVDGTLRVVKVVEQLPPWRLASARHAWAVLEIAAGEVRRRGVAIGDQLGVVEVTDKLGAVVASAGWDVETWKAGADEIGGQTPAVEDGHVDGGTSSAATPVAVDADDSIPQGAKVLLVGTDRRFRSVAAALLTRRGCAVTLGDRTVNIADLARREAADVVVLDAGVSLTDAAHGAAQIETLDPPVGVVVVGEEAERSLSAMPVLPKWGSFDALFGAIEHARPARARRSSNGGGG